MPEQSQTYSIVLRVRRATYEDAYVAVPVTDAILKQNEDGTSGINPEAFVVEAVRLSHDQRVEWRRETSEIEPHPIPGPKPEDRNCFDAFHDGPAKT